MLQFLQNNRTILQVLAGAFMISFSAIWVRLADVPPETSGLYRVFFGFLFLLVASFWQKEIRIIPAKNLFWIIFCGVIFSFNLLFWHKSIFFIGPGLATVIGNFQVFLLAATGILFFGEKIRPRFLFSIPVALLGLLLVVGTDWNDLTSDYRTGIYFALLTAVSYAGFIISLRKIQHDQNQPSLFYTLMLISFVTAICLALKMVLYGDPFIIPDTYNLFILLCLAFFSQVLGWLLISHAMPKIRASLTGFILLLQPTLSFIWDVLFFARPTDLINWLGLLITLTAIYMGITGNIKKL
jgi:drug/metabolite transporter (DMT)-like permease